MHPEQRSIAIYSMSVEAVAFMFQIALAAVCANQNSPPGQIFRCVVDWIFSCVRHAETGSPYGTREGGFVIIETLE
ncbi:hypothetical protein [Paraburkholderia sp. MM6662-R1]|uniref:hypothetical protein n=1 Tax=Paraburkholderia sp. MM6662-R1 TaxID=2991066 RepID=UPI003D1B3106